MILKKLFATLGIISILSSFFLSAKPIYMLIIFISSIVFVAIPHYFSDEPKKEKKTKIQVIEQQQFLAAQKRKLIQEKLMELNRLQGKNDENR